jgi:hypothetical protein
MTTPPDYEAWWCEEVVRLRDALVKYLVPAETLLQQGHPDLSETHVHNCRVLLQELEAFEVNPFLKP